MSDILGKVCFSDAPFRWVKHAFFHRCVLWPVGAALALGLPLALAGVAADEVRVVVAGTSLCVPFLIWLGLLATISLAIAVPRFVVLGLMAAGVYFGLSGMSGRVAAWAARHQDQKE